MFVIENQVGNKVRGNKNTSNINVVSPAEETPRKGPVKFQLYFCVQVFKSSEEGSIIFLCYVCFKSILISLPNRTTASGIF